MTTATADKIESEALSGTPVEVARHLLSSGGHTEKVLAIIQQLVARNAELERILAERSRPKNRAEGVTRAQLDLFLAKAKVMAPTELVQIQRVLEEAVRVELEAKAAYEEAKAQRKQRAARGARELPAHLARIDNPISVPDEHRACPKCQGQRTALKGDPTPVIELIPAQIVIRNDSRELLVCKACDGHLERAPKASKVVDGGRYGPRLVASLLVDKFDDALPLHRSHDRLLRLGFDMPLSSMTSQMEWATDLLEPLWRHSRRWILASDVMHMDSTSMPVMLGKQGLATGTLWAMAGVTGSKRMAAYLYCSTGKARGQRRDPTGQLVEVGPLDVLDERRGSVVLDAATLFDPAFRRQDLEEAGCNMHSRRYYKKALDAGDARAAIPLSAFKALYFIEESVAAKGADQILEARQRRAKPIYDAMLGWSRALEPREPPSSALGRAVAYQCRHAAALTRYLGDARLPPDNGLVERLHRRPALVRAASLFAGSHEGGKRAAIAFSITATCRLERVNAVDYLADVLPELQRGVAEKDLEGLMPAAWKAAHPSASLLTVRSRTRFR